MHSHRDTRLTRLLPVGPFLYFADFGLLADFKLLADLRTGFETGSRSPTWVTYSPVTSEPRTTPESVCSPALDPSFHVSAALPRASVTARLGVTVPDFTAKFILASGTGFP
jgi:hypothetical protein